ncbi:MAG: PSD1 and planctomycete cytochrome C domain-containing protein [Planctomycetota bacterium]
MQRQKAESGRRSWPWLAAAAWLLLAGCAEQGQERGLVGFVAEQSAQAKQASQATEAGNTPIDFAREIRPILSDRCFACHGPDAAASDKLGGFRLDSFDHATAPGESGAVPIVPGRPEASELIRRINSNNPNRVMPPPQSHLTLTAEEKVLLTRWIEQGAAYTDHWAYQTPKRRAVPKAERSLAAWAQNDIDLFIAARMSGSGLLPSPQADRATLIRRASLDLTGLPPTPRQIDAFVNDPSDDAYEKVVDRLLASPHFGERLALVWLDAARYADTIGYQLDHERNSWPYRQWVVNAFNDNLPYDRFVVYQLAGDLVEGATQEHRLATAFCRMHMMNHEGGSIDEEFRVENVADRIETIATVFMGQTYNCARCHDHKYDPISQDDYFSLFAYFSSIPEKGVYTNKAAQAIAYPPRMDWMPPGVDDPERAVPISVMQELEEPRQEYVLSRGAYDQKLMDRPAVRRPPGYLGLPLPEGVANNRLGFAQWLVRPDHPLTSRVHVNRLWQMLFGNGIVRTPEDFGSQAQWPTHPDLLDHLAVQFVESGWDQKALIRQIVTSATYRQRATRTSEAAELDPENRLLSHFPRRRMSGELIRDQALFVSGLLSARIGGPSVRPYQPPGLWRELSMRKDSSTHTYIQDEGEGLYRRSLYTFLKRKVPPPQMSSFGAPNREACVVRRDVTNTPMQALVLWNDEQLLEAARALAQRTLGEADRDEARLSLMFRRCTGRTAGDQELGVLREALAYYRRRYNGAPEDAEQLLKQGQSPIDASVPAPELAAWMMVGNVVLSLDETIVRD